MDDNVMPTLSDGGFASLTSEQRSELARRDAELDANPHTALTWEQIRASIESKQ
jgi:putative addiction module component (TIGR02574 family)